MDKNSVEKLECSECTNEKTIEFLKSKGLKARKTADLSKFVFGSSKFKTFHERLSDYDAQHAVILEFDSNRPAVAVLNKQKNYQKQVGNAIEVDAVFFKLDTLTFDINPIFYSSVAETAGDSITSANISFSNIDNTQYVQYALFNGKMRLVTAKNKDAIENLLRSCIGDCFIETFNDMVSGIDGAAIMFWCIVMAPFCAVVVAMACGIGCIFGIY